MGNWLGVTTQLSAGTYWFRAVLMTTNGDIPSNVIKGIVVPGM